MLAIATPIPSPPPATFAPIFLSAITYQHPNPFLIVIVPSLALCTTPSFPDKNNAPLLQGVWVVFSCCEFVVLEFTVELVLLEFVVLLEFMVLLELRLLFELLVELSTFIELSTFTELSV
jgi:hypothetical protein